MRAAYLAVAVAVLWSLAGCAAQPAAPPRVAQVTVGMSAAEVESLLGEPARMEQDAQGRGTNWYYHDGVVILRGGKVAYRYPEAPPED